MVLLSEVYKSLRGTHDILPEEVGRWQHVEAATRSVFERYGFQELRTPVIEETRLFKRGVGDSTDIVNKEMYTIQSGSESITLRPENTAPLVRAFVEHSLHRTIAAGFPERYYYLGPMFRHERPQKGRQRQFHQIGAEVLGSSEAIADAETIEMLWVLLDELGVGDRELRMNSLGDAKCRPLYRSALVQWLQPRLPELCEDCHRRFDQNPLRVLDCKVEKDRKVLQEAPRPLDHLCAECEEHFASVRAALEGYGIPFAIDKGIVRGLDYYQRTVFEVISKGLGAQDSLLGGGRYDGLVQDLGGPATPGFGFAMGIERLLLLLPQDLSPKRPDLFLVSLDDAGFRASVPLAQRLRRQGMSVLGSIEMRPLSTQMKRVTRSQARYALFVGGSELSNRQYNLKNLDTQDQAAVDETQIAARVLGDAQRPRPR